MKKLIIIIVFLLSFSVSGQNLYKTPSGRRYHLATCRMVKNVSQKVDEQQIIALGLTPCKICHPPSIGNVNKNVNRFYVGNKAAGEGKSVRCRGLTKRGTRCKHHTRIANGYCFQHQSQVKQ